MIDVIPRMFVPFSAGLMIIGFLPCVAGCHEFNTRAARMPNDGEDLPILHQAAGTFSHEDRSMRLVVRDASMLAQIPLVDVPVDFDTQMVLIITLGRRLSDRYAVRISRVWREGPVLRVTEDVVVPPPEAPLVPSSPFCLAVVPRCDFNVEGFSAKIPHMRARGNLGTYRDVPKQPEPSTPKKRRSPSG